MYRFHKQSMSIMVIIATILIASPSSANDSSSKIAVVNSWFASLAPENSTTEMEMKISNLLTEDATIVLKDLNIIQSKTEFIDSLDAWSSAIQSGYIAHKIQENNTQEIIKATVCYNFGANALMTREEFTLLNNQISKSVQNGIAENCDEF